MKAVVIRKDGNESRIAVAEVPKPGLKDEDEVLIKVLSVGLDGTDKEIIEQQYGALPAGAEQMIIGHELLGVIVEAGAKSGMAVGEYATVLVRRPCLASECANCRDGRQDFCVTDQYTERGIRGADGFLCEYVVEKAKYVVPLPSGCAPFGVLIEPQSVVEKVWAEASIIQKRLIWRPKAALVIGSGPLGLLAALTCRSQGLETHVWSMSAVDSVNAELIRRSGGTYHYAGATGEVGDQAVVPELAAEASRWHVAFDIIWECSGHSPLAFDAMRILNHNGLLALLGVTPGGGQATIPSDQLNREMVMKNKCVIGSVNSSRADFIAAIDRLQEIERQFPGLLEAMAAQKLTIDQVPGIDFHHFAIKAVITLA